MAMDQGLTDDLRAHLETLDGVVEQRMLGGVGFMWQGNLLCGVMGDELLVRVGKAAGESLIGEEGAHPMTMGGRSSRGWILVPMETRDRATRIATWVDRAVGHVETLPPK